jgi:hypothetical protein
MVVRFVIKHRTLIKFNRSLKPQANTRLISTRNSEIFRLTSITPPHTYRPLNLKPTLLSNRNLLNLYLFDKYLFKVLSLFHTWSLSQPFLTLSLVSSLKSSKSKTFLRNFKEYSLECYLLQKTLNVNNLSSSKNYEINLNNQTVLRTINFF